MSSGRNTTSAPAAAAEAMPSESTARCSPAAWCHRVWTRATVSGGRDVARTRAGEGSGSAMIVLIAGSSWPVAAG
ncbi:MAG: hypothetical protein IT193_14545 [Propionibacteriaceae bacterium]|nr:hypothetical protein [Propionibacteriaceae bacterium]